MPPKDGREYQRRYRQAHPELYRESQRRYRDKNRAKLKEDARRRYEAKRAQMAKRRRRQRLIEKYGLSVHGYERILQAQGGKCAVGACTRAASVVDHHHGSGIVRALLCNQCNVALGMLNEDAGLMESLAAYARQHACEPVAREGPAGQLDEDAERCASQSLLFG
jgi:hypothetical protein